MWDKGGGLLREAGRVTWGSKGRNVTGRCLRTRVSPNGGNKQRCFLRFFSPLLPGTGEGGNDSFFCRFLSAHAKRKEFFVRGRTSAKTLPISSDFLAWREIIIICSSSSQCCQILRNCAKMAHLAPPLAHFESGFAHCAKSQKIGAFWTLPNFTA